MGIAVFLPPAILHVGDDPADTISLRAGHLFCVSNFNLSIVTFPSTLCLLRNLTGRNNRVMFGKKGHKPESDNLIDLRSFNFNPVDFFV